VDIIQPDASPVKRCVWCPEKWPVSPHRSLEDLAVCQERPGLRGERQSSALVGAAWRIWRFATSWREIDLPGPNRGELAGAHQMWNQTDSTRITVRLRNPGTGTVFLSNRRSSGPAMLQRLDSAAEASPPAEGVAACRDHLETKSIRRRIVRLNPPKKLTWLISLVLGAAGVVIEFGVTTIDAQIGFAVVLVGLVLMLLATLFAGL
jgi:hypothetical protein